MALTETPQLFHEDMLTWGGTVSPGRCVSLLPTQLHICVLEGMPGGPKTFAGSKDLGRLKRLQGTHRGQSALRPFALSSCSGLLLVAGPEPHRSLW